VARALRELGFKTSYVGHLKDGAPPKGTPDQQVLAHATTTSQVVVTSNHDMILLCREQAEYVVWIDPRGRQFKVDELVLVAFKGIAEWERLLSTATGPVCIRVLRTKVERLTIEKAAALCIAAHQANRIKEAEEEAASSRTDVPERLKSVTAR
jgi:hypothetical protein